MFVLAAMYPGAVRTKHYALHQPSLLFFYPPQTWQPWFKATMWMMYCTHLFFQVASESLNNADFAIQENITDFLSYWKDRQYLRFPGWSTYLGERCTNGPMCFSCTSLWLRVNGKGLIVGILQIDSFVHAESRTILKWVLVSCPAESFPANGGLWKTVKLPRNLRPLSEGCSVDSDLMAWLQ